jgi:mannose-1-phosphate guanylyltransferase
VEAFVEKPDVEEAREYLDLGYSWNTGIFIFPVARFLAEIRRHAPEIGDRIDLLDRGQDATFFQEVPIISVDEAVMERSDHVGMVKAGFTWDDVGGWEALARTLPLDRAGNAFHGPVHAVDATGSVAWSDDGPVVLFGVEGLVVVRSGGLTMVTTRERAPALKELLARLPDHLRETGGGGAPSSETGRE